MSSRHLEIIIDNLAWLWIDLSDIRSSLYYTLWWSWIQTIPPEDQPRISPWLPVEHMLKVCWFVNFWTNYPSFSRKNITDIWWWFSWLPFLIQSIANQVNLVDPTYNHDIETFLDKEMERTLSNISFCERLLNEQTGNHDQITKNIKKFKMILENLEKRKQWKVNENTVKLLWSVWESISWIDHSSQDFVFIVNVLDKDNTNPYLILSEAHRLLKPWWIILIVADIHKRNNIKILRIISRNWQHIWTKFWVSAYKLIKTP